MNFFVSLPSLRWSYGSRLLKCESPTRSVESRPFFFNPVKTPTILFVSMPPHFNARYTTSGSSNLLFLPRFFPRPVSFFPPPAQMIPLPAPFPPIASRRCLAFEMAVVAFPRDRGEAALFPFLREGCLRAGLCSYLASLDEPHESLQDGVLGEFSS